LRREYHAKLAIAIALQLKAARHPASHSGFLAKIDLRLAQTDIFKLPITILTSSLDSATPVSRKRAEFGDQTTFSAVFTVQIKNLIFISTSGLFDLMTLNTCHTLRSTLG